LSKRKLGRLALVAGVLLGVTGLTGAALYVVGGLRPGQCSGDLALPVTVTSAVEPVARQVAADFTQAHPTFGGRCVLVQIAVGNAAEIANQLPYNPVAPPALWIPDSTLWAQRAAQATAAAGPDAPKLEVRAPLAMTPLVVAAAEGTAATLGYPGTPLSWQRLLDPGSSISVGDPTITTEGLAALLVGSSLLTNPDGSPRPELTAALLRMSRAALPSVVQAFTNTPQGNAGSPFTATEQAVFAVNHAAGKRDFVAMYPAEGTLALDSPVVRVTSRNEDPGLSAAANAFETALRSSSARKHFADAGFRDPQGAASVTWTGSNGVRSALPKMLPAPPVDRVAGLLRSWSALTIDTRMLTVIDVSTAMRTTVPGGGTRVQLARDVALTALAMLPDSSNVGLWAFSSRLTNDLPYRAVVSIGPLAEPLAAGTRRQVLQDGAAGLPGVVHGQAELYDTTLAAFRAVRQNFDPRKINSVVLMTDGHNQGGSGMDLATLVATLRAENDPAKPVVIIPVGIGQDADMQTLGQIASATGAKAYQAKQPSDVRTVLLDAFDRRKCRPNC
jgi:hypothetical protein